MISPQSAYIHIPFCRHRCGYCNFTLLSGRDELMEQFVETLELELAAVLEQPHPVATIFLGGGTPTHLAPDLLERLLRTVNHWLPIQAATGETATGKKGEFSCEANPLDCDDRRLKILVDGGVNRLSLGGQSFSARKLQLLERDHSPTQLMDCLERCTQVLDNCSLDLIFAVPGESTDEWYRDLRFSSQFRLQHVSTYGLTIERGAAFYGRSLRQELVEIEAEQQLEMYEQAIEHHTGRGWVHYEVSSFAAPGRECTHNQAYWRGQPWWAFGPGAASFLWDPIHHCMVRAVNHPSTTTYMRRILANKSPIHESETLTPEQRVRERLVFGLRMLEGVEFSELDRLLGTASRPIFEPALSRYLEQGWLQMTGDRVRLTHRGLMISDSLWPDLLRL